MYGARTSVESKAEVDVRPLTDEERCRLDTNLPQLIRLLDSRELSSELLAGGVLTHQQYEHLRSLTTPADQNNDLVDILVRRSYAHFKQFLKVLRATGQGHVADILTTGGGQTLSLVYTIGLYQFLVSF